MFAIRILPEEEQSLEGRVLGEIAVDNFVERFVYTGPDSPESAWKSQLQSLLDGQPVVALIHDPRFAWVVYREENLCFVQQHLSPDGRFNDLLPRQITTEEGERISEWPITIEAIRQFVRS
jgi:hypothetical protein